MSAWSAGTPGILPLPPGRLVRGRGLRRPLPDGTLPEFGVYLLNKRPEPVSWDARWVRWPDFRLPPPTAAMPKTRCTRPGAAPRTSGWNSPAAGSRQDRHRTRLLGGVGRSARSRGGRPRARALRPASRRNALAAPLRHLLPHVVVAVPEADRDRNRFHDRVGDAPSRVSLRCTRCAGRGRDGLATSVVQTRALEPSFRAA